MASNKELEQRVAELENLLARRGIVAPPGRVDEGTESHNYVPFGSERHAVLLGILPVEDVEKAKEYEYYVYTSPTTGKSYRLEDQVTQFMHYPDPAQVARLVLQQKINVFEAGPPPPPDGALPLWNPDEF